MRVKTKKQAVIRTIYNNYNLWEDSKDDAIEKIKANDKSDTIEIAANFLAKLLCRNIDVDPRYYWVLENLYELIDSLVDFIRMYKSGNVVQRKYLMSPGDKSAITVKIEED